MCLAETAFCGINELQCHSAALVVLHDAVVVNLARINCNQGAHSIDPSPTNTHLDDSVNGMDARTKKDRERLQSVT